VEEQHVQLLWLAVKCNVPPPVLLCVLSRRPVARHFIAVPQRVGQVLLLAMTVEMVHQRLALHVLLLLAALVVRQRLA